MATKKKAPAKVATDEAEKIVLDYMKAQNRPYNSKMVFENLHNALANAQVAKALDDLAERGALVRKENKKQHIYWASQDDAAAPDATVGDLDAQLASAKSSLASAKAEGADLAARARSLGAQPTDAALRAALAEERAAVAALGARAEALRGGGGARVDPGEKRAAEAARERRREEWRRRRRLCRDVVEGVTEGAGVSARQLAEDAGIELDDQADAALAAREQQAARQPAAKRARR
eukprot:m51a1_g5887 putative homologous-pairing protein 2 homolog isoform x2 (235) ;mRNA; r:521170-522107